MLAELSTGLAAASAEALESFGELVTINGATLTARVQTITRDEIFVGGGNAENGGFKLWITKAALPVAPQKRQSVVARAKSLRVILVEEREAHWIITAEDYAAKTNS